MSFAALPAGQPAARPGDDSVGGRPASVLAVAASSSARSSSVARRGVVPGHEFDDAAAPRTAGRELRRSRRGRTGRARPPAIVSGVVQCRFGVEPAPATQHRTCSAAELACAAVRRVRAGTLAALFGSGSFEESTSASARTSRPVAAELPAAACRTAADGCASAAIDRLRQRRRSSRRARRAREASAAREPRPAFSPVSSTVLSSISFVSAGTTSAFPRSTSSRCAWSRHVMFGCFSVSTSFSGVASFSVNGFSGFAFV